MLTDEQIKKILEELKQQNPSRFFDVLEFGRLVSKATLADSGVK